MGIRARGDNKIWLILHAVDCTLKALGSYSAKMLIKGF